MDNRKVERKGVETIGDKKTRLEAEDLVVGCGVRVDLKGSEYLVDAIILFGLKNERGCYNIYRRIGEARGVKAKTVMREMSYALSKAYGISDRLSERVGVEIPATEIHNGLVMGYLGRELYRNRVKDEE